MMQRCAAASLVLSLVLVSPAAHGAIPSSEREALIALYNATNGPGWSNRSNWLGAAGTECTWHGVQCNVSESSVVEIALIDNGLSGTIPSEIADLTRLRYIYFGGNDLRGTIPSALATLGDLEWFSAYQNRLDGPLPTELGQMPNLRGLSLGGNEIDGTIPESFRNLMQLEGLKLHDNQLTGAIPTWIGELRHLQELTLGANQLAGGIPDGITDLVALSQLDLAGNRLTGPIPEDLDRLVALVDLNLEENALSGMIPAGVWTLTNLESLRLGGNLFTGVIPAEVGDLILLDTLYMEHNQLSGEIPSALGSLPALRRLALGENRLSGSIPAAVGNLTTLERLGLERNALSGSIPLELQNLANLEAIDLRYNALVTDNESLRSFVNALHEGGPFEETQTVAPGNVSVSDVTDRSAVISWSGAGYLGGGGGYEVEIAPAGGGARLVFTTASKELESIVVRGLAASTDYQAVVRSTTHPHGFQQNFIRSQPSETISFTTTAKVIGPAIVDVVSRPGGLFQIGGVPENQTSYTLANFGDVASAITLAQSQDELFFTQSPGSFTLEPGERQIVTVSSVSNQAVGFHWGHAWPVGDGVPENLSVTIPLLSVPSSSGEAVAVAVTKRIEFVGTPSSDAIGSTTFDNIGTATLNGILISDAAWIDTPNDLVAIRPGERQSVSFTVRRARRPDAEDAGLGSLFSTLRLVYVDGLDEGKSRAEASAASGSSGASTSLVTVVDTTAPPTSAAPIPPLRDGEVVRIIAGIVQKASLGSDIFLTNSFGAEPVADLEIFFQPVGSGTASVASFDSLMPGASLALGSVLGSVFGESTSLGSLVVRTLKQDELHLGVVRTDVSDEDGTFTESLPVVRSDRGIEPGGETFLTGIRQDGSFKTTLNIQEVSGHEAKVIVEAYDRDGSGLGMETLSSIPPFGLAETTSIPDGTVSLVVRNHEDESTGNVAAWALVESLQNLDLWTVTDWRLHEALEPSEAMRVPIVIREGVSPSRRRPIRRPPAMSAKSPAEESTETLMRTTLSLFNPDDNDAVIDLVLRAAGAELTASVTVPPGTTKTIDDVSTFMAGSNVPSTGYLVVTPRIGSITLAARLQGITEHGSHVGASIPIVGARSGLRLGQARTFSGLADSTRENLEAHLPGTTRTSLGLEEIDGNEVTVRATLLAFDGRSLAGTAISRDFTVGARQVVLLDELARSILGTQRETTFGEMHNLQLELRVVDGEGAVDVFVMSTDGGSGDPVLRLE